MNGWIWLVLVALALFGVYRQLCIARFYLARRREQRVPFRGVVLRFRR